MVSKSYQELSEEKVELFVESNMFELLTPLMELMSRSDKRDQRKVQKIKNELSTTN